MSTLAIWATVLISQARVPRREAMHLPRAAIALVR